MARNWQWLDGLTKEDVANKPIPFKQLLEDSVYYPACGTDGAPVQYLHHLCRSFIYVDYNYSLERLKSEMLNHGFMGYEIFAERLVSEHEITPKNFRPHEFPSKEDGDPRKPFDGAWVHQPSYAYWTIWQRTADFGEEHGPIRFSLFNLCADGVASFDALYYTWETKPLVFCIIRPGTGYGLNWTDFREPGQIMHRLAMNNPVGAPEYMLMEKRLESEDDQGCHWPKFGINVESFNNLVNPDDDSDEIDINLIVEEIERDITDCGEERTAFLEAKANHVCPITNNQAKQQSIYWKIPNSCIRRYYGAENLQGNLVLASTLFSILKYLRRTL